MSNSVADLLVDRERARQRRLEQTIDAVEADADVDLEALADRAQDEPDIGWLLESIDESVDEDGGDR